MYVESEVTSALPLGQGPITNAGVINFLLYGAYWPFLEEATDLLDDVNKVWKDKYDDAYLSSSEASAVEQHKSQNAGAAGQQQRELSAPTLS